MKQTPLTTRNGVELLQTEDYRTREERTLTLSHIRSRRATGFVSCLGHAGGQPRESIIIIRQLVIYSFKSNGRGEKINKFLIGHKLGKFDRFNYIIIICFSSFYWFWRRSAVVCYFFQFVLKCEMIEMLVYGKGQIYKVSKRVFPVFFTVYIQSIHTFFSCDCCLIVVWFYSVVCLLYWLARQLMDECKCVCMCVGGRKEGNIVVVVGADKLPTDRSLFWQEQLLVGQCVCRERRNEQSKETCEGEEERYWTRSIEVLSQRVSERDEMSRQIIRRMSMTQY